MQVLAYPSYEKELIVFTDSSSKGLGAVLSLRDDNKRGNLKHFASWCLNKAETNYSAIKRSLRSDICFEKVPVLSTRTESHRIYATLGNEVCI